MSTISLFAATGVRFVGVCLLALSALGIVPATRAEPNHATLRDRIEGMLIGSLIGDAAGGPVEFKQPDEVRGYLPATRDWDDRRRLTSDERDDLARSFKLLSYDKLRPMATAYAHWTNEAAAGTVTDDSRHKIVLMNTLVAAHQLNAFPISRRELAAQYMGFGGTDPIKRHRHYAELCEEGFREYNKAARWVLGERDSESAQPIERLWGGVPTNAGQMALLPLAAAFPGEPRRAYQAAYKLGFMDNGAAKDINSALVGGLATALKVQRRDEIGWRQVIDSMKQVDPYQYGKIPYVKRELARWLEFASSAVERAEGRPKRLFEILETDGQPRYYWDAHFVVVSALAILEFCEYDALASMHLSLDFGHDTDSTAQLVGAFVGAVCGKQIFPVTIRNQVMERLREDYGQSVTDWTELLVTISDREEFPRIVTEH